MLMHTPTLFIVNILVTAVLAISLGVVSSRERRDGLRFWAAALALNSLAMAMYGLRGVASDWVSIVLANALLSAHLALVGEGLCQFQRRALARSVLWGPVLLVLLSFALLIDHIAPRIVLASMIGASQGALLIWLVLSRRAATPGRGQYFVVVGYALLIVMLLGRMFVLLGLDQAQINSITDSNLIQALTFMFSTVTAVLVCLGLVLMTKEWADERNRTLALQDELTGLDNRRAVGEQLARQLALAQRNHRPLALLIIDIDHFKRVNDTHGHLAGDQVLRTLALRLQSRLRTQDALGRWGGEEFLVLLSDTDGPGARVLAEQLRTRVAQTPFMLDLGDNATLAVPVTISIGLHAVDGATPITEDRLIAAADEALYRAKLNGRNRVESI